jgi:hypothetical protein
MGTSDADELAPLNAAYPRGLLRDQTDRIRLRVIPSFALKDNAHDESSA